ncbi:MAG: DUF5011 domain-containing protein [Bacteroidales bacterium]|nr:DUF5011 domain-containing protein [Bacteroidales bacterium]
MVNSIMRIISYIVFASFIVLLSSCEKWYETADVSHVTCLPEFSFEGGDFISLVRQDSGEYDDQGVTATANGKPVAVYTFVENYVDVTTPGIYTLAYYAENPEGFSKIAQRIVAVTYEDVSGNDLAGTYSGTVWDPVEATVIKISEGGLYKMDDVMGYPGYAMPGRFVDLGQETLILLPGEGYFGEYDFSEGQYTRRTLSWDVILLTAPYEGIEIPVIWRKVE